MGLGRPLESRLEWPGESMAATVETLGEGEK